MHTHARCTHCTRETPSGSFQWDYLTALMQIEYIWGWITMANDAKRNNIFTWKRKGASDKIKTNPNSLVIIMISMRTAYTNLFQLNSMYKLIIISSNLNIQKFQHF